MMNDSSNYTYSKGVGGGGYSKSSLLATNQILETEVSNVSSKASPMTAEASDFISKASPLKPRLEAMASQLGSFPIDAFPAKIQDIILDMVEYQGYKVAYYGSALLAAAAATIGNSAKLTVQGTWTVPASLYFLIVGRAGWGKTPPMNAAFAPLMKLNQKLFKAYQKDMAEYRRAKEQGHDVIEPELRLQLLSDATIESLKKALSVNANGVADVYDEIMGWLNTGTRNNSSLIEDLLSIYSGSPLITTRVSNPMPLVVQNPCLTLIGGIQTERLGELDERGLVKNGFVDRFQIAFPENALVEYRGQCTEAETEAIRRSALEWESIINFLSEMPRYDGMGEVVPNMLTLSPEATEMYDRWWRAIIAEYNAAETSGTSLPRTMKRNNNTYRMALVLQVLRWACDEASLDTVDSTAMAGAIALNEYYEDCYRRAMQSYSQSGEDMNEFALLDKLPLSNAFTTGQLIDICADMGISRKTAFRYLTNLLKWEIVDKIKHGVYARRPA